MSDCIFPPGALSKKQLGKAKSNSLRILEDVTAKNLDKSSFDLTLSDECWKLPSAVKPKKGETYKGILKDRYKHPPNSKGEFVLDTGTVYIFRIRENVNFRKNVLYGLATGKSSLGRLDLLVRLATNDDKAHCYDYVNLTQAGHELYVEIVPITFRVKLKKKFPISQLRIFSGKPELNAIPNGHLQGVCKRDLLKTQNGGIFDQKEFDKRLTVNLEPDPKWGVSAFVAKREVQEPIDLPQLQKELDRAEKDKQYKPKLVDPHKYWEAKTSKKGVLLLERERFYILRSCERLYLPTYACVGCEAVKEELGELRIHYAGFAHPWFGRNRDDDKGTPLIFEVRGHNFDTQLRQGEALAELEFYWMSESIRVDKKKKTKYDTQELQLSKYFEDWK